MSELISRLQIEQNEEWKKWVDKIPFIDFPIEWIVKPIPPFAGAMVRFIVKSGEKEASVYLDVCDRLGCYGKPYWEVYPVNDDVFRCDMNDVKGLLSGINESFSEKPLDSILSPD